MLESIASEEEKKKDIKETEEVKKEETKTSTDSIALFNKIYEKHIGSKMSLNVNLIFMLILLITFIYNKLNIKFIFNY